MDSGNQTWTFIYNLSRLALKCEMYMSACVTGPHLLHTDMQSFEWTNVLLPVVLTDYLWISIEM